MKLALLGVQGVLLCAVLLLLGGLLYHQRRTKQQQDALLDELLPGLAPQQRWFRVNVARQPFFARRLRMLSFEAKGLLIDLGEQLRLVAVQRDGARVEWLLPKSPESVRWDGNVGLRAGNLHWLALGVGDQAVMVSADTGLNAVASREATADLLRALLPRQPLAPSARGDFALEKNAASRLVVVVFIALLLAVLADHGLSEYQALHAHHVMLLGLLAVPLWPLIYLYLSRRQVPGREALTLVTLLTVLLAVAVPRAALRLDQWLADAAVATPYRLAAGALLQPVQAGPPDVRLRDVSEYWAQFEPGSVHELDIVRGPLGLWQLDRRRLNAVTRAWYLRQDAATPAAGHPASTAPTPPR
ncbi:MAG TPA: hypothetical protein VGE36_04865 [Roseateles sp.]